jgi:hypothetical protein
MKKWVLFLAMFGFAACGSDRNGSGGAGGSSGSGGSGGSGGSLGQVMSVHTLRTATPADGTLVTLQNVVVIGRVTSSSNGHLWVQDSGGGMQTGVHIFCNYGGSSPTCTNYTKSSFDAFTRGQVLTVTGKVSHFTPSGAPATAVQLELDAPTITVGSGNMDPVATDIAAAMVDKMAGLTNDQLRGTYFQVTGGPFTVASIQVLEYAASCSIAGGDGGSGTTYRGWQLQTGSTKIDVGTTFYETMHWYVADPCYSPPSGGTAVTNQSFTTLKGVVEAGYDRTDNVAYLQISPVIDGDLVP